MNRLEDLPPILTPNEVAEILKVTPQYTCELIRFGKLRATNIGMGSRPTYRISREDVIAYLHGDTEQGHGPGLLKPQHLSARRSFKT